MIEIPLPKLHLILRQQVRHDTIKTLLQQNGEIW